jgi:hypothetical protein
MTEFASGVLLNDRYRLGSRRGGSIEPPRFLLCRANVMVRRPLQHKG